MSDFRHRRAVVTANLHLVVAVVQVYLLVKRGANVLHGTSVLLLVAVVVVLVAYHQFLLEALGVLSVLSSLVWYDIWWTCIFELVSDLIKVCQERVIPGLPGRRRSHSFEWEAQRGLVNAPEVAVLRLVEISRRLCQVQLVQLVVNVGIIVLNAVTACGRHINVVFGHCVLSSDPLGQRTLTARPLGLNHILLNLGLCVLDLRAAAVVFSNILMVLHNFCEEAG